MDLYSLEQVGIAGWRGGRLPESASFRTSGCSPVDSWSLLAVNCLVKVGVDFQSTRQTSSPHFFFASCDFQQRHFCSNKLSITFFAIEGLQATCLTHVRSIARVGESRPIER